MYYIQVIILIIMIFTFSNDRKVNKYNDNINKKELENEVLQIKENLEIIKIDYSKNYYNNITQDIKKVDNDYILIMDNKLKLKEDSINMIINNYILNEKQIMGINAQYILEANCIDRRKRVKNIIKKLLVDGINYLNIFNRHEISSYSIIILKKEEIDKIIAKKNKVYVENIISLIAEENNSLKILLNVDMKDKLKELYIDKIKKSDFLFIIKMLILIIASTVTTANMIASILNGSNDIIVQVVIYFCYSYLIRYIYTPIKKERLFATYIFPVYFIAYIFITIYSYIIRFVHAS